MTEKSLRNIIQQLFLMSYMLKNEYIYPLCNSKHNLNHENQILLLMIPNGEGWDYLAVKKLSVLLRGIISKHAGVVCFAATQDTSF